MSGAHGIAGNWSRHLASLGSKLLHYCKWGPLMAGFTQGIHTLSRPFPSLCCKDVTELLILQPPPPECWITGVLRQFYAMLGIELKTSRVLNKRSTNSVISPAQQGYSNACFRDLCFKRRPTGRHPASILAYSEHWWPSRTFLGLTVMVGPGIHLKIQKACLHAARSHQDQETPSEDQHTHKDLVFCKGLILY